MSTYIDPSGDPSKTTHVPHRRSFRRGAAVAGLGAVLVAGLLVGCTPDADDDGTPTTTPTSTATATPTSTATASATGTAIETVTPTETVTETATETGTPQDGEPTPEDAVAVIDEYFVAIAAGDFETAYLKWRDQGAASGQSLAEFEAGYADTHTISWTIGEPGRVDPGAGQRFIEIPVTITAETTSGETREFEGSYVLHRTADIPGSTEEDRRWSIHSAEIVEVE